jgi:hypothetical protein
VVAGHLAEGHLEEDLQVEAVVEAVVEEIINNPSTYNIKIVEK